MALPLFRIGLVVNPLAGLGGPVALKGTDGEDTVARAISLGAVSQVPARVAACLRQLLPLIDRFEILTISGAMGADICASLDLPHEVVLEVPRGHTRAIDTKRAVQALLARRVNLVLFAGGDGTARDVCDVVTPGQVVLGLPCGVKMHSGVFANNPVAAALIMAEMIEGKLVSAMQGEVRDIDEASFRGNQVRTRHYGEMWVPEELRYLQQVKSGGKEIEALAVQEIAAQVIDAMADDVTYFLGSGSTTAAISQALGLPSTLLGVDVVRGQALLLADARESQLLEFAEAGPCQMVITAIGGQGHIFGRGNQQLSARVIRAVGPGHITLVATKSKLEALAGKPLLVDTGDPALDQELAGTRIVITGYEDAVLYPVVA